MTATATVPTTETLEVPGARLTYDVRRNDQSTEPILFLIASPMAAAGFGTLAGHFTDRTVVTYDPRGSERSELTEPTIPPTPEEHAADLHRIIQELGGGPVDLFASSGGAVNALALVAEHPDEVRTLIAHEPPLPTLLPDREAALAAARAVHETYEQRGWGAGMAHFITLVSHRGEFPADFAQQPGPDPAMFGMPAEDDGSRDRPAPGARPRGVHRVRARLRRPARRVHPNRHGRRCGVGGRAGEPRCFRRRRAARHRAGDLPQQPRRLPWRRVRTDWGSGCLRGQAAGRRGGGLRRWRG